MKLEVKVIAGASQEKIVQDGSRWKVYVRTVREKGKANDRVIEIMSEHFGKSKSQVKIVRGEASKSKIIEVSENG